MYVGRVLIDRIEVHDTLNRVDVNTAGGHIGGDQRGGLALGEVVQCSLALVLAPVAVNGYRRDTGASELASGPVGAVAGAGVLRMVICP